MFLCNHNVYSSDGRKRKSFPFLIFSFAFTALLILSRGTASANGVTISNVELVGQDSNAQTIDIEFDITWSNSWYDSVNHDAVWVFAKYCTSSCTSAGATWSHAKLATSGTNPAGFGRGTKDATSNFGSINIKVPADKTGAFIEPAHPGSGTLYFKNVQLIWDYGADGVADATARNTNTRVKLFAIEMTYIPEGGFYAGDGMSGAANTKGQFEYGTGTQDIPPAVNSESGISFRNNSTNAWYYNTDSNANDAGNGAQFDVSESFPKGYRAFYLMKYELSQGMYRDFLNSLTATQLSHKVQSSASGNYVMTPVGSLVDRQNIKMLATGFVICDLNNNGAGGDAADGDWIAMNYISWPDLASLADWAGLRPISELEYEKAARGPLYPVTGEYAWGTSAAPTEARTLNANAGQNSETFSQSGSGLVNYNNSGNDINGPARPGFASTSTTTSRLAAGAGFYGNMDLSGNLAERVVTLGDPTGRAFAGTHGDGILVSTSSYEGNASNTDWPGIDANSDRGVTGNAGTGERGGSWSTTTAAELQTSDRRNADHQLGRDKTVGGRLARTSPEYD